MRYLHFLRGTMLKMTHILVWFTSIVAIFTVWTLIGEFVPQTWGPVYFVGSIILAVIALFGFRKLDK